MASELEQRILDRLQELIKLGEQVKQTSFYVWNYDADYVDARLAYQWGTSSLNLLEKVLGETSTHYKNFYNQFDGIHLLGHTLSALGILGSAQEDYQQKFLFNTRVLIEAEVFDDFLEQAEYLLESGYYQAAVVLIGGVLEDGLRKLCTRNNINLSTNPKVDAMNADLAKHGVYTKLKQKQITALADVRNKAAHGKWNEFDKSDVTDMLAKVRQLMEEQFSN